MLLTVLSRLSEKFESWTTWTYSGVIWPRERWTLSQSPLPRARKLGDSHSGMQIMWGNYVDEVSWKMLNETREANDLGSE